MIEREDTAWQELEAELAAWTQAGLRASLWWRDDDAVEPTAALDRLLDLAARSRWPLALAVVPAGATRALAERLEKADGDLTVLQHGFAHRNFAPADSKKIELGGARALPAIAEELARGAALMTALFGPGGDERRPVRLPVLVPPWNRIAEPLIALLPELGFHGLSADGRRAAVQPAPGLLQVNTQVDILRWKPSRGFLGTAGCLARLVEQLRLRRLGTADRQEPIGILTHHLAHDEAAWRFIEQLLPWLARRPAIATLGAKQIFAPPAAGTAA